jgi:penicillin-binding protein 1A
VFLSLAGLVAFCLLILLVVIGFDTPGTEMIDNPNSDQSSQLISADGQVLHKYYSQENRANLSLNEISPYVVAALVATEDVRYNDHSGIDPRSFFSILKDVITGDEIRGGSTITMQLCRNLYEEVGNENKWIRKLKEYITSAKIERRYTKREIMEAYLNTVNIYGNSYGIETTSNRLFDKHARSLTIEEAALVVGMLKGQGVYNPFRHAERTEDRRNTILEQMAKYYGSDPIMDTLDLDSIRQIPIARGLTTQEQTHIKGIAPYFREYSREWLTRWCEDPKNRKPDGSKYDLYTDGLRVYSTIDARYQQAAEQAMKGHLRGLQGDFDRVEDRGNQLFKRDPAILIDLKRRSARYQQAKRAGKSQAEIDEEFREKLPMTVFSWAGDVDTVMSPMDSLRWYARVLEAGLMSVDPRNGYIRAWVGGIDYKYFKYDHVKQGKRQVGSTFKPFVYGTAVEAGYTPCDEQLNQPVTFENVGGGRWTPKNADGGFGGKMTLKRGLANSVNLITARLMKEVGPHAVADFAHKLGITSTLDEVPSLCLGTTDLSVFELTHAYSTMAAMGVRHEPIFITRIEDKNGKVIATFVPEETRKMKERDAFLMVELLKGVVDAGTAQRLRYRYKFRNDIGGKTGTTQNQSDGWFMGITPNLVTGVWVGHADRRVHFRSIKYGQGANMGLPIWAEYYKELYENPVIGMPALSFERPNGVTVSTSCRGTREGPSNQGSSSDDFNPFGT